MQKEKLGFFARLKEGLQKTNDSLVEKIGKATTLRIKIDDELLEELEEALIMADIGMPTTIQLLESLRQAAKNKDVTKPEEVRPFLEKEMEKLITVESTAKDEQMAEKPHVILMIGVNGAGKTTTIGKLANHYKNEGKKVLLGAADTFRAAAVDQLAEWSNRIGCDIVKHHPNSDPSAVVFDAMKAGIARKKDIVIIDTAGRLHTRTNLMDQLAKMRKIITQQIPEAPHETLLVLDGTTGQNALNQVKEFNAVINVTGLVITKLDGSSKGGAVVGIVNETGIPVKFVGIGEKIDDLQPFDPEMFSKALL